MHPALQYQLNQAGRVIRAGGVIAYPTEGVWGLGCDPQNEQALERLLHIKQRSLDKGLILIGSHFAQLKPYLAPLTPSETTQLQRSWPGPFTWVVPHRGDLPGLVTGGRPTLAVRVPGHPIARALCKAAGTPLVSTSANLSGRPALRDALSVRLTLGKHLDTIVAGAILKHGKSSQVRDLRSGVILRP